MDSPYESNHGDDSLRSGEGKEPALTTNNNQPMIIGTINQLNNEGPIHVPSVFGYDDAVIRAKNEEIAKLQARVRELEGCMKALRGIVRSMPPSVADKNVQALGVITQALKGGA